MATAKLASLFIKTMSKPLAGHIKKRATSHPSFRKFCIGVANTYNRFEIGMRTEWMGFTHTNDRVPPLNEVRALELGANFLSESIIFSIAIATILGETYRREVSSTKRENAITLQHEQEIASILDGMNCTFNSRMQERGTTKS